nr:hypothetical protein [Ardenticatena sp.]
MKERCVLLQGDVDAIKSYVFESPGLLQIRGGSQGLVECEEQVETCVQQLGGQKIYCSGGSFLFMVPVNKIPKIKKEIENIYLKHTLVTTVTIVYEDTSDMPPLAPSTNDGWAGRLVKAHQKAQSIGKFARRTAFLAARLRDAKQKKNTVPFIEACPFGKRCDLCGKRIAEKKVTYTEASVQEIKRFCLVCAGRNDIGRKARHQRFTDFAQEREWRIVAEPARDLDTLVQTSQRPYIAFLYADGNNIGWLLQQVKNEQQYGAFSDGLRESTEQALFEALWEVCGPALEREQVWPFEIINIGGDDITLLIQAGYVWDVAIAFLERFECYVRKEVERRLGDWPQDWPECITASVGIAVADVKYPMRYLESLAEDLLKRAKKTIRQAQTSAIDFLWLSNAIAMTQATEMVDDLYRQGDLVLTARPYTLAQAKVMQTVVDVLSRWPRSLRHRWGEALERSKWSSLGLILYDLARRMSQNRQDVDALLDRMQHLTHSLGGSVDVPMGYLWWESRENQKVIWRTALLDALELAELRAMRPDVEEEDEEAT